MQCCVDLEGVAYPILSYYDNIFSCIVTYYTKTVTQNLKKNEKKINVPESDKYSPDILDILNDEEGREYWLNTCKNLQSGETTVKY